MEVVAVVAAAGLGTRLGRGCKAMVRLNGRSLLARALTLFLALDEVTRIVVVGPPGEMEVVSAEVRSVAAGRHVIVGPGGATRQESVRAGLERAAGAHYVLIHDAARPLASAELCRRVLAGAIQFGAAIPGVQPQDAVRRVAAGRLAESLDRSELVLAQTPQAFAYGLIMKAHQAAHRAGQQADDDAQLMLAAGHPVLVVAGEATNIKLTTEADMALLDAFLRQHDAVLR